MGAVDLQVVADVQGQSLDMIIGMNIIPGRLAQPLKEKETAVRKECSDIYIHIICIHIHIQTETLLSYPT